MKRFEVFEHTADTGIVAYGGDIKEAFASAAYGMFSLIADLDRVAEDTSRYIEVNGSDRESLAVSWLNELLYFFDVDRIIFKRFDLLELTATSLRADAYGEVFDGSKHELRGGIKAATYHMLEVSEKKGDSRIRVIFDV